MRFKVYLFVFVMEFTFPLLRKHSRRAGVPAAKHTDGTESSGSLAGTFATPIRQGVVRVDERSRESVLELELVSVLACALAHTPATLRCP